MSDKTAERIPAIGDMLVPRPGTHAETHPGVVVSVLPSGDEVVLARRRAPDFQVRETVHQTVDLKGPMSGIRVSPLRVALP